ncbi:hypothetical protein FQR65_LT09696 [Abscondita terminalis]|nr:hypothetical protein FQR65_LT09696 [Abscondita terminalis]
MELEFLKLSDEEYVVERAKRALKIDPVAAKAWMITAKTLYPNNFSVQFEAYKIEKEAGHLKEAAKYFSDLLGKFQQEPEFWQEMKMLLQLYGQNMMQQILKSTFYVKCLDIFPLHQLLLFTADHCEDAMEHCRLLLLLLQKFPTTISTHGPRLVDTLLSAEKHSHASNQPINPYRKLLVCDLLPLLATENSSVELSSKLLFKLIHKSTEFYLCSLDMSRSNIQDPNISVEDPWKKLFGILELTGRHLGWESYLTAFGSNWTKESYWQRILTFCQTHKALTVEDHVNTKQLLYCLTIFFLHCLHDYNISLSPEACPGQVQTSFILVEGFTDANLPNNPASEPKSKRRKGDDQIPLITVDKAENKNIISNFQMAVNCWDLFHSSDHLQREFGKLNGHIKLDPWLFGFLIDYAIYKSRYDDALGRLQQISDPHLQLAKNIRHSSIMYLRKNYTSCFEPLLLAIQTLPMANKGTLSTQLITGTNQRHLHFLPITQMTILQYCTKLLIRCIKDNMLKQPNNYNELSIGHILVLLQLDWPQEEDLLPLIIEQIRQRGAFSYLLFQAYIINVDILEELTYLWTEQGGQITLDILPHLGQRRIGTRGADKGVKEEIKHTIKRQIARIQTWFVPDEYWQSLEVAHNIVFNYGYLTWEWMLGIRSYIHPLAIAFVYKILQICEMDHVYVMVYLPRILQALLSAYADYCFYNWCGKSKWAVFNIATAWFWYYVCSRTLINTTETALTMIALTYFPWDYRKSISTKFLWIVSFMCLIRPTATIQWLPLAIYYALVCKEGLFYVFFQKVLPIGTISFIISTIIDSYLHGKFIITSYEFLKVNVFDNVGEWYGTQPWYWYLSTGLLAVLGIQIVPFSLATVYILRHRRIYQNELAILGCITFSLIIYSCLSHKEFRFILPLLPMILKISSEYLSRWSHKAAPLLVWLVAGVLLISNIIPCVYLSIIHQRGTLHVMEPLRKLAERYPHNTSLLFLMPCHSTPLYSHLHRNVTTRFLTCEPNFHNIPNYQDEADQFYNNPNSWLRTNYPPSGGLPSHIIAFDSLVLSITDILSRYLPDLEPPLNLEEVLETANNEVFLKAVKDGGFRTGK